MNSELTVQAESPIETSASTQNEMSVQERIRSNEQLVAALAPVIKKNHVLMQGDQSYVRVAGGIAIANALGFTIATAAVEYHDDADGKYYSAEAMLIDGGKEIGRATGYLGMDEDRWSGQPVYARRSMCSTRAVARLLRQNFGHFYVALGHSDTPSEEVPQGDFTVRPMSVSKPAPRQGPSGIGTYEKATTPAPSGESEYHVTAVDDFSKEGASWTKYTITLAEGFKVVTFKADEATMAEVALSTGKPIVCKFTGPNQYGTYDLKSIMAPIDSMMGKKEVEAVLPPKEDIPFA